MGSTNGDESSDVRALLQGLVEKWQGVVSPEPPVDRTLLKKSGTQIHRDSFREGWARGSRACASALAAVLASLPERQEPT
jgi:hypothetical protein